MWEKWKSRRLHCPKKMWKTFYGKEGVGARHLRPILHSAVVITRRQAGSAAVLAATACNLQLCSSITSGLSWLILAKLDSTATPTRLGQKASQSPRTFWSRASARLAPCFASLVAHTFFFCIFLVAQPSFMTSPASWVRCLYKSSDFGRVASLFFRFFF